MIRYFNLLLIPWLYISARLFWLKAIKSKLPAKEFFQFGRELGIRYLKKGHLSPKLLVNPVSIVRYFEFDFVNRHLPKSNIKILDVSSPFLLSFYLSHRNPYTITYINPDDNDLNDVRKKLKLSGIDGVSIEKGNAHHLFFDDNSFNCIVSVSVIEHIEFDNIAITELWRTLKPGGLFLFTVPVKRAYEEDHRHLDAYGLNEAKNNQYFFQRFYDWKALENRIFSVFGNENYEVVTTELVGESMSGQFTDYEKRWLRLGQLETRKDPYRFTQYFRTFNRIEELPGLGVIGIVIKKIR